MKLLHLGILLFACFSANAQRVLIPHDFLGAIRKDSCVIVGEIDKDLELALSYQGQDFYRCTGTPESQLKIGSIKDSLFKHIPNVKLFWDERAVLPRGKFCLKVHLNGAELASRCQLVAQQRATINIRYGLDSFTLSSESTAEDELLSYRVHSFVQGDLILEDELTYKRTGSFAYSDFRRNTPFVLKYVTVHTSGIVLSDTNSKRFIPNRALRRDSVKKAFKTQKDLLKQEIKTFELHPFDSLKPSGIPGQLASLPRGTVSATYGMFQGQNLRFPSNNFFDIQAQSNLTVLGIPIRAQAYFFDNGIDLYNRRDLKLSLDYHSLIADMEAKKQEIEALRPDKSMLPSLNKDGMAEHLPDTAKYAEAIRSKKEALTNTKGIEKRLMDSLEILKGKALDSLHSDSMQATYGEYQTKRAAMEDSIALVKQRIAQIEKSIAKAEQLKKRYESGLPADSILASQKNALRTRATDSVSRYLDLDKYLAEKGLLSKHEEEYKKARALYEKLKKIKKLDLGTINVYESPFSLSGISLRGISTQYDIKEQRAGITAGKMIPSPFFVQNTYNIVSLSDEFDILDWGTMKTASTNFWVGNAFQSISEVKMNSAGWKGWKAEGHLANSINQNYFSNQSETYPIVNAGNTSLLGRLSKSSNNGLHSIEGQYKYVPASYFTPGNPFLINDIRAGTLRLNNTLFNQSLTSFIELEVNQNNTLKQLSETTFRKTVFSFQQLNISESFQLTVLNSVLLSNGLFEQSFRMHDANLQYASDLWGAMLNTSLGFMFQEFETDGELNNRTSMIKGSISLLKKTNRMALSYYKSVPMDGTVEFSTANLSVRKSLFKELLSIELRGGVNSVQHMNPRLNYGAAGSLQIYKGMQLTLDYQGNSLLIQGNQLHANSSLGFIRMTSSF